MKLDVLDWGESEEEENELTQSEEEDDSNDNTGGERAIGSTSNPTSNQGEAANGSDSAQSTEEAREEGRICRPPMWMNDYESGEGLSEEEVFQNFVLFTSPSDPATFEEAIHSDKWRTAMDNEIEAIKKNNIWELTDLPAGARTIGVKWIFKTNLNENGEVEKYKARLVAKGYSQKKGVDYTEVFAPVARWDTIRMVIALAAQKGWNIYQLDVKSAFLH